jgi:Flp pilus assembly protein TadB
MSEDDHPVPAPPAGEEIHLPGPSLLPLLCAIALTLVVIGTTINLLISAVGLVALVIIIIRWVADTRRAVAELPEEHLH